MDVERSGEPPSFTRPQPISSVGSTMIPDGGLDVVDHDADVVHAAKSQTRPAVRARAAWRTRWSRSATSVARSGGLRVRRTGGRQVAAQLVQVAADRVPPMTLAEHLAQPVGLAQPRGGAEHVADRDRAAEHRGGVLAHRVVAERDQVVVPGEDLRPVGLLGACRIVVQGGDGGLDLVAAGALLRQRRLQHAHALGDLARCPSGSCPAGRA